VIASRSEDWRAAVGWLDARQLDRPAPILLAAGLIEADALRQPHAEALDTYCVYPLTTSLYPLHVPPDDLIPLPYHRPGNLDRNVRRRIVAERGAWLVIRGRPAAANAALNDVVRSLLQESSDSQQRTARWRIAEQRSFGKVHIVRLTN
jgi:hypothetical protein